jgi:NTP pyrophosphatase (non-canonical NTP hydrolase)
MNEAIDNVKELAYRSRLLTFRKFSEANRTRCESPSGFNHTLESWSLSDWITAATGELGEAANVVKKLNRVRDGIAGNDETPFALEAKLRRELADVFIYLDLIFQRLCTTLADEVLSVFNEKSKKIGYKEMLS